MTTQEVMNYLETSLKPQIATLTEAINLALQSSSTVVANSSGAMAILSSALSATAGNVVLENGVVVPNLKKMLDEVSAVSGTIRTESQQSIEELRTKSQELLSQLAQAASGIDDSQESGSSESTYSSVKILALIASLKSTLEATIETTKGALENAKTTQGEKITALEVAKQEQAGKISALEVAKSAQAEKIALLEGVKENHALKLEALENTAVKLEGEQTLANKTLNAPILTDPKINLGSAGAGQAGQVLISQGEGLAPQWGNMSNGAKGFFIPEATPNSQGVIPDSQKHRLLTAEAGNIITISPQSYGESIQLPATSTLEAGTQYSITNSGAYPLAIFFDSNKALGTIAPATTELIVLKNQSGVKRWEHNLYGFYIKKELKIHKNLNRYGDKNFFIASENRLLSIYDIERDLLVETMLERNVAPIMFRIGSKLYLVAKENSYNNFKFYIYEIRESDLAVVNIFSHAQTIGEYSSYPTIYLKADSRYIYFVQESSYSFIEYVRFDSHSNTFRVEQKTIYYFSPEPEYSHKYNHLNSKSFFRVAAFKGREVYFHNRKIAIGNQIINNNFAEDIKKVYYEKDKLVITGGDRNFYNSNAMLIVEQNNYYFFGGVGSYDYYGSNIVFHGGYHAYQNGKLIEIGNKRPLLFDGVKYVTQNAIIKPSAKNIKPEFFNNGNDLDRLKESKTVFRINNKNLLAQIADEQL